MNDDKLSRAAPICERDCFNCKFADCIREDLTAADYDDARALEAFIHPPTPAQRRIAAKQKAYYEENREAIAAKQKAYYEENREAIAAKQKAYREENREAIAAKQKAYREENRESIAAKQKARVLSEFRREHGMTQARLGRILGVSQPTISLWETGAVPFDLEAVLLKAGRGV